MHTEPFGQNFQHINFIASGGYTVEFLQSNKIRMDCLNYLRHPVIVGFLVHSDAIADVASEYPDNPLLWFVIVVS